MMSDPRRPRMHPQWGEPEDSSGASSQEPPTIPLFGNPYGPPEGGPPEAGPPQGGPPWGVPPQGDQPQGGDPYGGHGAPYGPPYGSGPGGGGGGGGGKPQDQGPKINAARLWAGGVATAIVAALITLVGLAIGHGIFAVPVPVPAANGLSSGAYVGLAVLAALVATALVHTLMMVAPRPLAFFAWIVFLATVVAAIAPFVNSVFGSFSHIAMLNSKIATALINLALGIAIGSLISGVAHSAVTCRRPGGNPQVPPQGYRRDMR